MKELRRKIEDNYLTFIGVAAASEAVISIMVWVVTVFVKKIKTK